MAKKTADQVRKLVEKAEAQASWLDSMDMSPTAKIIRALVEVVKADEPFNSKLFAAMGLKGLKGIEPPVIEDASPNLYIKLMSDGGKRDAEQGMAFQCWLDRERIKYNKRSERSFIVPELAIVSRLGNPFTEE